MKDKRPFEGELKDVSFSYSFWSGPSTGKFPDIPEGERHPERLHIKIQCMEALKPSDVRVGNLLFNNVKNEVVVADSYLIYYLENWSGEKLMTNPPKFNLAPILLTEEWLTKAGFEDQGDRIAIMKDNIELEFKHEDLTSVRVNGFVDVKCLYVHQLQNIHYAICGEELAINWNVI